jgi:hypothetical protein
VQIRYAGYQETRFQRAASSSTSRYNILNAQFSRAHIITFLSMYVSARPCTQIFLWCRNGDYIISLRWDSSVHKAVGLGWLPGVRFLAEWRDFLYSTASGLVLKSTQVTFECQDQGWWSYTSIHGVVLLAKYRHNLPFTSSQQNLSKKKTCIRNHIRKHL